MYLTCETREILFNFLLDTLIIGMNKGWTQQILMVNFGIPVQFAKKEVFFSYKPIINTLHQYFFQDRERQNYIAKVKTAIYAP